MNKFVFGILLCLAVVIFDACGNSNNTAENSEENIEEGGYQKILPAELKKRIDNQDNIYIVDVRTSKEYEESHIPGAVSIPNESIGEGILEQLPDLNAEIVVYCRSGVRSRQAADQLIQSGYTHIYDMGGINDWSYDTVSGK